MALDNRTNFGCIDGFHFDGYSSSIQEIGFASYTYIGQVLDDSNYKAYLAGADKRDDWPNHAGLFGGVAMILYRWRATFRA